MGSHASFSSRGEGLARAVLGWLTRGPTRQCHGGKRNTEGERCAKRGVRPNRDEGMGQERGCWPMFSFMFYFSFLFPILFLFLFQF
jgi:hypothetical protein